MSGSVFEEYKEDIGEFERHLPGNNNKYPIDPKLSENPLCHLSRWDMVVKRESVEHMVDFEEKYEFGEIVEEKPGLKIVSVKEKRDLRKFIVKIYDTFGDLNKFDEVYKEFIFVRETELIEYDAIYYNKKVSKVYIIQPQYSKTSLIFNDEAKVKLFAADLLNQIWIIHRSGYIYGDIKPQNIVKREFNDNNEFIEDGYKLNNFVSIKKYKSKGNYIGTPGWTPPEMVIDSHKNKYLYSNDIFAFGLIILYALNNGKQPLEITYHEKAKYGQNEHLFGLKFKNDLQSKMYQNWYYKKLIKAQNMIKNYLIQLYFDSKISLDLFNLLHDALLVFDCNKRWNCNQIYHSNWFQDIRQRDNKKKLHKLRISIDV